MLIEILLVSGLFPQNEREISLVKLRQFRLYEPELFR